MTEENTAAEVEAEIESPDVDAEESEVESSEEETELSFEEWEAQQEAKKEEDPKPESKEEPKKETKEETPKQEPKKEEESKPEAKIYKVKIDGKEEEFAVSEDQIPEILSKAIGAGKKFDEAANIRKEAQEFVTYLKENPIEALGRLGIDFEKMAEDHLYERYNYDNMSDSEREAYDNAKSLKVKDAELKRYKDQEEAQRVQQEEAKQKEEQNRVVSEQKQVLEQQFIQALESSNLPKNKFTISRMAMYMKSALQKGKNLSPMDVVEYVRDDYAEAVEHARKADVASFKREQAQQPQVTKHKPKSTKKKRITSIYDLME